VNQYEYDTNRNQIAIVGMACRLPGDTNTPAALWQLLVEGRDAVEPRQPDRMEPGMGAGAGNAENGSEHLRTGGYLRDVAGFDADFFGVSRREADVLDPQHRLLLEVSWEALEHAGIPPTQLDGTSTGVFAGMSYNEYMDILAGQPQDLEGSVLTNGHCVASGRISYLLGLHGPSVTLDTACSSSLVAVHLASQALRAGECDLALAAGVTLILGDRATNSFARMGMLSPTARCHAFDAAADGFVRGEGCGVIVLKRLADAVRDDDRVLAVVRGSAVNQDGRSEGLAAPSAAAQAALFQDALKRTGVDPGDVGLIETHGTGTPVGDPVEFASLAEVYGTGRDRCALGSVKTNLGHLETASGITGLIKTVLCLEQGQIPRNLHFTRWNPVIAPEQTRFFVPTELTEWPVRTSSRLAAVSSFGFSGTNAHVLLESAPDGAGRRKASPSAPPASGPPEVFLVTAGSADVLTTAAERLAGWLEDDGATVPLRDVAHTLALRRSAGRGRMGVVASTRHELIGGLRSFARGEAHGGVVSGEVAPGVARRPVWVFSGQGSQWSGMGRQLLEHDPVFAAALAEADPLIAAESGFSVLDIVRTGQPVTGCGRVQPVLFALQVALAATWRANGVEPAGVIGHSMGEVAAAVVAGALSLADGARVICRRSALLSRIGGTGAMATIGLDQAEIEAELIARGAAASVSVAVLAAPGSTVVAGAADEIERLVAEWDSRGVSAHLIAVDVASHSPQVEPLLDELAAALSDLNPRRPDIRFYSTVLDDPGQVPGFDAAYWCANLRRPVRFRSAVSAAAADRHNVFIEVSPHPVVAHAVVNTLSGLINNPIVLATLRRDQDDLATFRTQLAAAHCAGVAVDWSAMYADGQLADPPTITFDRKRHWVDVSLPSTAGSVTGGGPAGLPGVHAELPGERVRHHWRGDAGTAALPWLTDHRVHTDETFPGAAYCAVALTVAGAVFDAPAHEVEITRVRFRELLRPTETTELSTTVTVLGTNQAECEIFARGDDGAWVRHATAVLRHVPAPARAQVTSVATLAEEHPVVYEPESLYENMRSRGIEHGPAFAGITELHLAADGSSVWARVELPDATHEPLFLHPALLDVCAQVAAVGLAREGGHGLILPAEIQAVRILGDPRAAVYCHAQLTQVDARGATGQARLLDEEGRTVVEIDGLRLISHDARRDASVDQWFFETGWRPRLGPTSASTPTGSWLVIGASDGNAQALAELLRTAGARAQTLDIPVGDSPFGPARDSLVEQFATQTVPQTVVVLCTPTANDADPTTDALRRTRRVLAIVQAVAASHVASPRVYVVTQGAQQVEADETVNLGQSAVRGLMRVLAYEHPDMRPTHVDADPADDGLHGVARELLSGGTEDEVVLRDGTCHVAHLIHAPLSNAERSQATKRTVRYGVDGFHLRAGQLGDLGALELVATGRRAPGPGEVEIGVRAAGVNFRDVLTAMGLLPPNDELEYPIGFECAGLVTAVGAGVTNVRPGDAALAIEFRGGAFGSFITVPSAVVAPMPAGLDYAAAAGLPAVFLTSWYALCHVGRLAAGERVLIHSAAGGTGLAAVAVAQRLGAEVLATAGTEEKRSYLRSLGVDHVMDSRSLDFAEQVRAATAGEGVDVVLNSLSGPAIRAGLETLKPFGRFVELGVRDIIADASLGLSPFRHNITMSTVDLIELQRARPALFATVLQEVLAEFAAGRLSPVPHRTFPLADATTAFRVMAGASHIGKLILTVPETGDTTAVLPDGPPVVHADGSYIITGGLRGVGLATARWLAESGAGHVVLNGRTAPSQDSEQVIADLRTAGTPITVVLGDIAAPGTAQRLVATATGDGLPLRGVVHAAMVLDDAAITNITDDQLERVWHPKVTGAWRLHEATTSHTLDWFTVYSSMASLLGNPGQGAYAAANSWLDGFAAWRASQGLPTLAVNWGPWGETGVATGFASRGYQTIPTDQGTHALKTLLAHGRTRTGVLPGEPDTWIPVAGRKFSLFRLILGDPEQGAGQRVDSPDVWAGIKAIDPSLARRVALEAYLVDHIRAVLRLGNTTLDPQTPLQALGFDSLLSIELRARLESDLDIKLASNFVYKHPTVAALATALAEHTGLELEDTNGLAGVTRSGAGQEQADAIPA